MKTHSVIQEGHDIQLATELLHLGARLQLLENETILSRGRLIKYIKKLKAVRRLKACFLFPPTGL